MSAKHTPEAPPRCKTCFGTGTFPGFAPGTFPCPDCTDLRKKLEEALRAAIAKAEGSP